ncbi:MAG: hypothetical protein COB08_004930 [Rhodobacteraceae bacterium]|nr:hypothetical protein [Paracoccaceae bacterium]
MKPAPKIDNYNLIRPVHPARPDTYVPTHLMITQQPLGFEAQTANQPKNCKTPPQANPKNAETLMKQRKAKARFHSKSP